MRGGGDVVDIVPVDVGFTAVETEPQGAVHILVAKEVAPLDAGFVVGVAKNGEGGNIVLRAVLLKDAIDLGDAVLAVSAVGGPEDEEFPLVGEGMERMRDVEGVEKDELGGFATDEKALPLVGTGEFFVDGGGRRPEVVFGGVVVLDQVDIDFVIDHDIALQILLGEGDDEILEYVGGSLGALEHGVKVFDDGLGRGVLEDTVVEIHDTVVEDGFGGAKNGIVVEGDIVEIVSEEIVTALVFGKGVARRTQQGGLHIAGGAHHLGEEHVRTLQNHGHFDTVEHEEFLIFIFLELGRVQFADMTGKVFGDLGVDAVKLEGLDYPETPIVKGDQKSISIAAASIIAKVKRDDMMITYASKYPGYAFEKNKGYGTKEHYEGLRKHGITPIHRRSFLKSFTD